MLFNLFLFLIGDLLTTIPYLALDDDWKFFLIAPGDRPNYLFLEESDNAYIFVKGDLIGF